MFTSRQIEIVRSGCGECEHDARGKRGRFYLLFFMLFARFQDNLISFFRGMPVAHHGKNPVWFVFHCTNKLQSQPIGLPKIFIDYFFFQAHQWDCTKSVSIFSWFALSEERWNQNVLCQICRPWVFPLVV